MNVRRISRPTSVALALVAMVLAATASSAWAHGGEGQIEVGEAEVVDALTVEFPIRITYVNDGHPAEEVDGLVVSGKGPDGAELGPTDAFTPGDAPGVFVARVELPSEGTWDLLIESDEPPASVTLTADASGPAVVAPGDEPDAEPPIGAGPPGDPDDPAVVDDDPASADDLAADDTGGDDSATNLLPIVLAIVAALAAGVVGYSLVRRRG